MKLFIYEGIELNMSSALTFIQSVVCMALLAPYRLVDAISTRIVYLKKVQIAKVLLYSLCISGFVTVVNAAAMIYAGQFSMTKGKVPLIVMLVCTIILLAAYFAFGTLDLVAYSQLEALSLLKSSENFNEEFNENFDESHSSDLDDIDDLSNRETETSTPEVTGRHKFVQNVSKREVNSYKDEVINSSKAPQDVKVANKPILAGTWLSSKPEFAIGKKLTLEESQILTREMDNSEKSSEFIDEKLLHAMDYVEIIEDDMNLEALNINLIPSKFKALA